MQDDIKGQGNQEGGQAEEEQHYLSEVLDLVNQQMEEELKNAALSKEELIAFRKEMYEDTVHYSRDFTRLTEMNQYLAVVKNQTEKYTHTARRVERYKKILGSPYFGRFDFQEEGYDQEKIYIGLYNVIDARTQDVRVYDWRAPISSIFYRYELGEARYQAPQGEIMGEVSLKRQYKIRHSQLKYFFDSSLRITDDALQEILGRNSSPTMRQIVETLQKEQDEIIRDRSNEVLIVQGVAGSGKTSIALHRIAYLMYEGFNSRLRSNNILIISPNDVFCQYISTVLPELGEENVLQATFDDLTGRVFPGRLRVETRDQQLELLLNRQNTPLGSRKEKNIMFKGSRSFLKILERLIYHYGHQLIQFEDVYYHGQLIESKQLIKSRFLNNKIGIPMTKQLKRIEKTLWERIHPLQKKRRAALTRLVAVNPEHLLEIKPYARLLALREAHALMERIHSFTEVDYQGVYERLLKDRRLFGKLAQGLELPEGIEELLEGTLEDIAKGELSYEDSAALFYLKLRLEGEHYSDIRQVVIDEAQDYSPLQYQVFKLLFPNAHFTILGDVAQSIEHTGDEAAYDQVKEIFACPHTLKLTLTKGYRSTFEISAFAQRIYGESRGGFPFERHGPEPEVKLAANLQEMTGKMLRDIAAFQEEGFETIAVIGKTFADCQEIYEKLHQKIKVSLVHPREGEMEKGVLIIPAYGAKGLEFDCALIHGADAQNYQSELDKRLLYIACTRALHRLQLYAVGEKSPFLRFSAH